MSDTDQDAYLRQLSQDGIKVVRVWVNAQPGGGACVKGSISVSYVPDFETTLGRYNYQTLDLLDKTLVKIGSYGMKALISPHDGNMLQGPNG
jgi:mannan endo-1,4-beta-mannosidase